MKLRLDDLDWRLVDGEVLALDVRSSRYLAFRDTGAFLWVRLAEGATVEQLTEALTASYAVDDETARADVLNFLSDLDSRALLDRT